MPETIYLRMIRKINLTKHKQLVLKDVAHIAAPEKYKKLLEEKKIYRTSKNDGNVIIIDVFILIKSITDEFTDVEIQSVGPEQTVIHINQQTENPNILLSIIVWIILFIGTAMTIMNFHYDVSMQEVQQKLHFILTGENNEFPLWIQIPYSLGLGVGTILFFNHWFKHRFNEEPSPLEVEIYNYQQNLNQYLSVKENKLEARNDRN